MAHAYTPGLKVLQRTSVDKERRLPLKGDVLVVAGKTVVPDDIVARTYLPVSYTHLTLPTIYSV